jgi:hypothetical protein
MSIIKESPVTSIEEQATGQVPVFYSSKFIYKTTVKQENILRVLASLVGVYAIVKKFMDKFFDMSVVVVNAEAKSDSKYLPEPRVLSGIGSNKINKYEKSFK